MELQFFTPKNKILQNYIEGYYFLTHLETENSVQYFTFPNNKSIVSVMENATIEYARNAAMIQEKAGHELVSDLICHYKKPIKLRYEGTVHEVTISFKPLGLNAFLEKPLSQFTNEFFSSFIPFPDYKGVFSNILREENIETKCELIENYWLSKLIGFQHPFLYEVIESFQDVENQSSISLLSEKFCISRQNLTKQFELHLCKSPSDFRKIERFRAALQAHLSENRKSNLTALSYDMLFYDQSHLIKDFKSLTGYTPKNFFKNVSRNADGKMNWIFV